MFGVLTVMPDEITPFSSGALSGPVLKNLGTGAPPVLTIIGGGRSDGASAGFNSYGFGGASPIPIGGAGGGCPGNAGAGGGGP